MAESNASNRMISIITSIFTSSFTINYLYDKSGQKGLWLGVFIILYAFIQILQSAIYRCCYTRQEENDVDKQTIHQIFLIINLTLAFVIITLFLDITKFFIAITHMKWRDYINILAFIIGFTLFIFPHTEYHPARTDIEQCASPVNRKQL